MQDAFTGVCGLCGNVKLLFCSTHVKNLNKEGLRVLLYQKSPSGTFFDICEDCCGLYWDPSIEHSPEEVGRILQELREEEKVKWEKTKLQRAKLFAKYLRYQLERF